MTMLFVISTTLAKYGALATWPRDTPEPINGSLCYKVVSSCCACSYDSLSWMSGWKRRYNYFTFRRLSRTIAYCWLKLCHHAIVITAIMRTWWSRENQLLIEYGFYNRAWFLFLAIASRWSLIRVSINIGENGPSNHLSCERRNKIVKTCPK